MKQVELILVAVTQLRHKTQAPTFVTRYNSHNSGNFLLWTVRLPTVGRVTSKFYLLLTMHLITVFVNNQLDTQYFCRLKL